ncbi:MEKHLA domain-containing protein [Methylophilaceae bacterium]|nr:MEKHLA domain-containing protein [Methylophilaceae bacterium]
MYTDKLLPLEKNKDLLSSFDECPLPIASHDTNGFFNYLNKAALSLFKVTKDQVIGRSTTMTAPKSEQKQRNELLNQVNSHGFIDNYNGIRVTSDGELFQIEDATIWNVVDKNSHKMGQAVIIYKSNKL